MKASHLGLMILLLGVVSGREAAAMGRTPPKPSGGTIEAQPVLPLTLNDCFQKAFARSETIAITKEEIEIAEAQFYKSAGESIGDVHFQATDFRQEVARGAGGGEGGVGGSLTRYERRERKFVISQPIFRGFRALGAVLGTESLKGQRTEEWFRAVELLYLDVTESFYGLLQYERDVKTIEEIKDTLENRVDELKKREDIGRSRTSEVSTAVSKMKILDSELALARGQFLLAQNMLEFLIGESADVSRLQDEELPDKEVLDLSVYLTGLDSRADVEASRHAMKTARQGITVAQSQLWPEVTFDHNQYEKREGFQSGIDWDFTFTVDVPIFQGGTAIGEIKESISEWKKSKHEYSLTRRQAELEIKNSYVEWKTSLERHHALQDAASASRKNFELQEEEYRRNLVNNLDVLEALETNLQTNRQLHEAHYDMKKNFWKLQIARGLLHESF